MTFGQDRICKISEKSEKILKDSINRTFGINDSIKIICYLNRNLFQAVEFIDYNKNSYFHKELQKTVQNRYLLDSTYYNKQYSIQYDTAKNYKHSTIPDRLITKWLPIYKYNGKFYIYVDCYWQTIFEVTDTTIINYPMDGSVPNLITSYKHNGTIDIVNDIEFNLVDNINSIYLIKRNNECSYYIPINSMNNFNIIVQLCSGMMRNLIEFEETKCNF